MKKNLKTISIMLVMALVVSLSACSKTVTVESLFTDMATNLEKVESTKAKVDINLGASIGLQGMSIPMNVDASVNVDASNTLAHMNIEMNVATMGSEQKNTIEMYVETSEDAKTATSYIKNPLTNKWVKSNYSQEESIDSELLAKVEKLDVMELIKEFTADFVLSEEKVQVNEKDCYEIKGKVNLRKLVETFATKLEATEDLKEAEIDLETLAKFDVPLTVLIYADEVLPAKFEIDFKELITNNMDTIKELLPEEFTQGGELKVDVMKISATYESFNESKVTLPDEVAKAEEVADDEDPFGLDGLMA